MSGEITFRETVRPQDAAAVREIVAATGFFHPPEVDVAVELVTERLAKGEVSSGYSFLFADDGARTVGYTAYGPIACTAHSFDLYWIAVHPDQQGRGLGRRLMTATERLIARAGGHRVYVETSGRDLYAPTRSFYEHHGYRTEAVLEDFYDRGDAKVVYVKVVG